METDYFADIIIEFMKVGILSFFVFLLAFQSYSTERLEVLSPIDSRFSTYQNIATVFFRFNELFLDDIIKINKCTVEEFGEVQARTYKHISSCVFFNARFFDKQSRTFRVHAEIDNEESFDFVVQWSSLSKMGLLRSLFRSKSSSHNIQITAVSPDTISSILAHLLEHPLLDTVTEPLLYLSRLEVDALQLNIQPLKRKTYIVHLSLFREAEEVYDVHLITNYKFKRKNDFYMWPVQGQEENNWLSLL